MAARVYETTAMRLIKLAHRLEDLKPTATELDRERLRADVWSLENGLDNIVDHRQTILRRTDIIAKDQSLCRRCGKNLADPDPVTEVATECRKCQSRTNYFNSRYERLGE